jgi:hypothetical protein
MNQNDCFMYILHLLIFVFELSRLIFTFTALEVKFILVYDYFKKLKVFLLKLFILLFFILHPVFFLLQKKDFMMDIMAA